MNNEIIFFDYDQDFSCETIYVKNILSHLINRVDNVSFVVTSNLRNTPETKYPKVVIILGDELGNLGMTPYQNQNLKCVFRVYNHLNRIDDKRIFPIPIGYNWTMHSDRSKKMVRMYPEKKLSERKIDVFFSGNITSNFYRAGIFTKLKTWKTSTNLNIEYNITNSFRTGLLIDDYYKLLGESKIILSPDGTSVDCFRYHEAFGSGCIVITTKKEPLWYYNNSPAIFINNWNELNESLIVDILNSNIDERYDKNLEYYNNILSENKVADYMYEKIILLQ